MGQMTFYPDAHEETTSVDGYAAHVDSGGLDWAVIRGEAGTSSSDLGIDLIVRLDCDANDNKWDALLRAIFLFDTSGLPDTATISGATLTLYGLDKTDGPSNAPTINIYASTPASNTALEASDFTDVGSTPFCDTAIAYADFNTGDPGDPNNFALNATGLAAISKTGISKFGAREATYDVGGATPSWVSGQHSGFEAHSADKLTVYRPKLVVTYIMAYSESASVIVGIVASATRALAFDRDSSVIVGIVTTASRVLALTRSASTIIGNLVSATKSWNRTITASTIVGVVVSASRAMTYIRTASVIVCIEIAASLMGKFRRKLVDFTGRALSTFTGRDLSDNNDEWRKLK